MIRFQGAAEAAAQLRHPNIVQVYEVGRRDGLPYFTTEPIEGGTLAQHLGGKPQPARHAAALLETLARAIHYAHQKGVIHRDLKPANILLQMEEGGTMGYGTGARRTDRGRAAAVRPRFPAAGLAARGGGRAGAMTSVPRRAAKGP